jgi:hypothetical protein
MEAVEKRLSRKVSRTIYKVTFLRLRIDDKNSPELKKSKVLAAIKDDFLGYAIIVNLALQEHLKKSYVFEAIIRDLFPWKNAVSSA